MDTGLKALVTTTDKNAQYDAYAKSLIARKSILAHILKNTIKEFKWMNTEDITCLIEGEVLVNKVPVDPGFTNKRDKTTGKIAGLNTEDNIAVDSDMREEVTNMGSLSQGIYEKGKEEGRKEGHAEEIYLSVRDGDYSLSRGMEKLNITDEAVFRKKAAVMGIIIP